MSRSQVRSLRVQVLLWTVLPLLIILLTFTLTGAGSHQFSIRQIVIEEDTNVIGVASQVILARLALYGERIAAAAALQAGGSVTTTLTTATTVAGPAAADGSLPPLELWHVPAQTPADGAPAPAWVTSAIASAGTAAGTAAGSPWLGLDVWGDRIVWVQPKQDGGWLVGAVPRRALGLTGMFTGTGQAALTVAIVAPPKRVVDASTSELPDLLALPGSAIDQLVDAALQGTSGVQIVDGEDGRQAVVAYAPLAGTPWAIILRRPIHDLVAPFFRLEQILPLILFAAALIAFMTLYSGLSRIVRPVHTLVDYANRIGLGDFAAAEQSAGGVQEIEDLRLALHRMAQLLQSERSALEDYLRSVTHTQEEERARLARELHDETVQTLIALDHKAQLVQRSLDKHPERTREQVAELRKLTSQATQELRRLSYGLRPTGLEEIGLASALEQLAAGAGAQYLCQGEPRRLAADKELAFYRIAQECLSNIRRHACAQTVRVMLVFAPAAVTLGVGDDGAGFDLPATLSDFTRTGHFGMMGITERTQLMGGQLYCESEPGRGTTVIVQIATDGTTTPRDKAAVAAVASWLQG